MWIWLKSDLNGLVDVHHSTKPQLGDVRFYDQPVWLIMHMTHLVENRSNEFLQ